MLLFLRAPSVQRQQAPVLQVPGSLDLRLFMLLSGLPYPLQGSNLGHQYQTLSLISHLGKGFIDGLSQPEELGTIPEVAQSWKLLSNNLSFAQ